MFTKKLSHITWTLARKMQQNARIRTTVRELNALTDRDLADLGICRGEIYRVAHYHATKDAQHA